MHASATAFIPIKSIAVSGHAWYPKRSLLGIYNL